MRPASTTGAGAGAHALHLARRFFGSLSRAEPQARDVAWLEEILLVGELDLWRRMSPPDRRHAVGVARLVEDALGPGATPAVLAAALLHDVGKVESGLGTLARVGATVLGRGPVRRRSAGLSHRSGPLGRLGRYLQHPEVGERLLRAAGSELLTSAWAGSHHRPPARWDRAVPREIGLALKAADDD